MIKEGMDIVPFSYILREKLDYFTVSQQSEPCYEQPCLSMQHTVNDVMLEDSNFVVISAAGATGKTMLANHLSYELQAPVLNLAKCDTIASNSLTGLLFKQLNMPDCQKFMADLREGKAVIIIDALDEGLMRTTTSGFEDFLKDLISLSPTKGVSFVLLGRTNVVEQTVLYLEESKCKVSYWQIEPFSEGQAASFLDKQITNSRIDVHNQVYRECKQLIISSIKNFFASQSMLKTHQSSRFLGYAPVLMAIAAFFDKQTDLQKTRNQLASSNKKDVAMIVSIVESILLRDKEQKIDEVVIKPLVADRSKDFSTHVLDTVYCAKEQCARTLYYVMGMPFDRRVTGDDYFNGEYEKKMAEWIKDHPFLSGRNYVNVVFEAYVLSALIGESQYRDAVLEYLHTAYKDSYILFYLFKEIQGNQQDVDKDFVRYLYSSLKALDRKSAKCSFSLTLPNNADDFVLPIEKCPLTFYVDIEGQMDEYNYIVEIKESDELSLSSNISNVHIDIPISVGITAAKVQLESPIYIKATKIFFRTDDIILNDNAENESIVLECNEFYGVPYHEDSPNKILNYVESRKPLKIISENTLQYPFCEYAGGIIPSAEITSEIMEKYNKCRKAILLCRGHSKGQLARYKDMLDNLVGNTTVGKCVLNALIGSGVLYQDSYMYFINDDKLADVLGCKYDSLRAMEINSTILSFLSQIKIE